MHRNEHFLSLPKHCSIITADQPIAPEQPAISPQAVVQTLHLSGFEGSARVSKSDLHHGPRSDGL